MSPEVFWRLHPTEWWWLLEAKRETFVFRGKKTEMTEYEAEELYELLMEEKNKEK